MNGSSDLPEGEKPKGRCRRGEVSSAWEEVSPEAGEESGELRKGGRLGDADASVPQEVPAAPLPFPGAGLEMMSI